MINTYNESSLHASLKTMYCDQTSRTEQKIDNWICDIVTSQGNVIEIQTKNVSQLYKKTADLLQKGHEVTIVHPIVVTKYIQTLAANHVTVVSKRKSPKKQTILSLCRELTGIYPVLLHKNFRLIVPEICITEIREQTAEPTQLINNSRHFLRNWIKTDKKLESISTIHEFTNKKDYLALLPKDLPSLFSIPLVAKQYKEQQPNTRYDEQDIRLMFWLYQKMGLLTFVKKEGRTKWYTLCN